MAVRNKNRAFNALIVFAKLTGAAAASCGSYGHRLLRVCRCSQWELHESLCCMGISEYP